MILKSHILFLSELYLFFLFYCDEKFLRVSEILYKFFKFNTTFSKFISDKLFLKMFQFNLKLYVRKDYFIVKIHETYESLILTKK